LTPSKRSEFDTEFKPRKVASDSPFAFRKLDSSTIGVPTPKRIGRERVHILKHKFHKTITCNLCGLPGIWFDSRIKHQFNECQQCECVHEMLVDNHGYVKKRIVTDYPAGYHKNTPFILRKPR